MNLIIPFEKVVKFDTPVSEISSISLEHEITKNEKEVLGNFIIKGTYKEYELSLNKKDFSFTLPFSVEIASNIDINTLDFTVDNFTYDLKDKDLNPYSYIYEDGSSDLYVLADMTGKDSLAVMTGLFYKVGEDDYILLDTFESSQTEAYVKNSIYSFVFDKLYGIGNGDTPSSFIYELDRENSKMIDVDFKYKDKKIIPSSIKDVDGNKIVFSVYNDDNKYVCNLSNYKCEIEK